VDNYFEQNAQPSSARAIQGSQQIGPQDPPVWKDDSWRMGNRFKSPGGSALLILECDSHLVPPSRPGKTW